MTNKDLFNAIHDCDDKWINEAAEQIEKKHLRGGMRIGIRAAAAAAACVFVLGLGVTVAAATSEQFHNWLLETFAGHEVTKVEMSSDATAVREEADIKADSDRHLSLSEDMEIRGENESFVCRYHIDGEEQIVDKVYSIREDGLKEQKASIFKGDYDGTPFSFEYVLLNHEIFGFNYKGAISCVYHYTDGNTVYVDLWEVKGDIVEKGCIAKLDLKNGTVEKLTDDDTICNSIMSPGGKMILLNYRTEGYWAVFDIDAGTEKKVEGINGYAREKEISFMDDYHVLAFGDIIIKNKSEVLITNLVDLRTQKIVKSYKEYGDIQMRWTYRTGKNGLKIRDITNGEKITIEQIKEDVHMLFTRGDYVLFGCLEDRTPIYLYSLSRKKHIKIEVPEKMERDVQIHLVAKEKKLLLTDGRECYLVDIGELA